MRRTAACVRACRMSPQTERLMPSDGRVLTGVEEAMNKQTHTDEPDWGDTYPYPTLDRAALYGPAGEIVKALAPGTEAAPVGMLLTLLVCFGNAAGSVCRALVGDDQHPARLFGTLVGPTASGAKGTSLAAIRPILRAADDVWYSAARVSGFASGEAIVARLGGYLRADDAMPVEKRALVTEPEYSRLLVVNSRDGSTASQILRGAWDEGRLQHIRAKHELLAEGVHLSLLGHITPDELRARLTATDISGGFANRTLFGCVARERKIPSPRPLDPALVGAYGKRLRAAMDFARKPRVLTRAPEAEVVWAEFYENEPEREGIVGEITARSAAQRLRLSVAYALLDQSDVVRPEHVFAAEALWRYGAASVEHIFGSLSGDSIQDRLLKALRDAHPNGLDGAEQHAVFGRNVKAARLDAARQALERRFLVETQNETTRGRERLISYAIPLRTNEEIRKKGEEELFIRLCSFVRTPHNTSPTGDAEALE